MGDTHGSTLPTRLGVRIFGTFGFMAGLRASVVYCGQLQINSERGWNFSPSLVGGGGGSE